MIHNKLISHVMLEEHCSLAHGIFELQMLFLKYFKLWDFLFLVWAVRAGLAQAASVVLWSAFVITLWTIVAVSCACFAVGLSALVATDSDSFVLLGSRLNDLLNMIIFIETQQAIETFGRSLAWLDWLLCLQAEGVEVMTTFEHLNVLPDGAIYDEILIAFIACVFTRNNALQTCVS